MLPSKHDEGYFFLLDDAFLINLKNLKVEVT